MVQAVIAQRTVTSTTIRIRLGHMPGKRYLCLLLTLPMSCILPTTPLFAAGDALADLPLESLMDLQVTTVSKRKQSLREAASAIYVIHQRDIERSGATSLPELLDLAPGLDVSRINSYSWGVSARGLKGQFSNKLLVLVDGRSVYHPYFSGVLWDNLLPSLNEIDRIEIIRGPGATLWGSNAVNGVINVITLDSELTTDSRVTVGAGNEEKGYSRLRQGFKHNKFSGRINLDTRRVDGAYSPQTHRSAQDDFSAQNVSARIDWKPTTENLITFDAGQSTIEKQSIFYLDPALQPFETPRFKHDSRIAWLQGDWLHAFAGGNSTQIKTYAESEDRHDQVYRYSRNTYDIELQYNFNKWSHHQLTTGFDFRRTIDNVAGNYVIDFTRAKEQYERYTAFLQDEISLSNRWIATLGIKIEKSDFTDTENQPSLRFTWKANDDLMMWSAFSHARRTPSTVERYFIWRYGLPVEINDAITQALPNAEGKIFEELRGNPEFESEKNYTCEIGMRTYLFSKIFFDITTYRTYYYNLEGSTEPSLRFNDPAPNYVVSEVTINNSAKGRSDGLEAAANIDINEHWRLKSAYTYTHFDTNSTSISEPDYYTTMEQSTPLNTFYVVSQSELGKSWEFDIKVKYVDDTFYFSSFNYSADAYTDLGARIAYIFNPSTRLSLIGKQLLDPARTEMIAPMLGPVQTEVERSIYLQLDWSQQ